MDVPTAMVDMVWVLTAMDTVPMATVTLPTPDTDTTMARGPLMLRPSPRLMLMPRLTTMAAMATPATLTATVPTATDTVPMATATPPTLDTDTTTARGLLMLRLGPHTPMPHMLMPHSSALPLPPATSMSPPPLPPMASASSTSVMPRPSPRLRLMPMLTTMAAMATPAMLMATVPTAMDTVPMVPTHMPTVPTTTKLLIQNLVQKKFISLPKIVDYR